MKELAARGRRNHRRDAVPGQPILEEWQFHRVPGAEEADSLEAGAPYFRRRRVNDVDQRQLHALLDPVRDDVQGVRAEDDALGSGLPQVDGGVTNEIEDSIPVLPVVQLDDVAEVERVDDAARGLRPAEPLAYPLVDEAVIVDGGDPTRPTYEAAHLHHRPTLPFPSSASNLPAARIFTPARLFRVFT